MGVSARLIDTVHAGTVSLLLTWQEASLMWEGVEEEGMGEGGWEGARCFKRVYPLDRGP